jgi:hypothetical protein
MISNSHTSASSSSTYGLWLTVSPPGQDIEITLIPVDHELMFKKDTSEKLAELIRARASGFDVFECRDIYATCEELKQKAVEFIKEPHEGGGKPEAMFRDDSGNFFGLCQASCAPASTRCPATAQK